MNIGLFAQCILSRKGGIERATARLASWLAKRGHSCVIYHWDDPRLAPQYPLHPDVQTCPLLLDNLGLSQSKRRLLSHKLDVFCCALSTKYRALFLQLLNKTGIPLLMSERSSPAIIEKYFMTRRERLACFAAADGIHLLSEKYFSSLPPFLQERTTVIPNAAPAPVPVDWQKREGQSRKILLAAGRLEEFEKKYSILIKAFALLAKRFPDWDCRICGAGGAQKDYQRLIYGYGLADRIFLPGAVDDMREEYSRASIFCIPSAFEGSPNALLEAQAFGIPSVGFASCSGVNDIIVDGENGYLVQEQTPVDLANALAPLMEQDQLRRRFTDGALRLISRYDQETLYAQWEAMLARVVAKKGHTRLDYEMPPADSEEDAVLCLRNLLYKNNEHSSMHNRLRILDILRRNKKKNNE